MGRIASNIMSLTKCIPPAVRQALIALAVVFLGAVACGFLAGLFFGWRGAEAGFAASFLVLFTFVTFRIVR
jgi:hypothetical protein